MSGNAALNAIGNKQVRSQVKQTMLAEKKAAKREKRTKRKRDEKELGAAALPPKQVPKTLDTLREYDETIVPAEDDEVAGEEMMDEFASYFRGETAPKIMITTSKEPRAGRASYDFIRDFISLFPKIFFYKRKGYELKKICEYATNQKFTALFVVSEDHKKVNGIWMIHLPAGPTAHFKLTSLKLCKDIRGRGNPSDHRPELILNNFNTRLGKRLGRMMAALFPLDPQFRGRRVVTVHNQRDFMFVRHHRYIFEDTDEVKKKKKSDGQIRARLQECGPRFTLKLRSLQLGTFDTQAGEYEWYHNTEMDTSRRRFHM